MQVRTPKLGLQCDVLNKNSVLICSKAAPTRPISVQGCWETTPVGSHVTVDSQQTVSVRIGAILWDGTGSSEEDINEDMRSGRWRRRDKARRRGADRDRRAGVGGRASRAPRYPLHGVPGL
eukprot:2817564-Rhodomonas_salina.1